MKKTYKFNELSDRVCDHKGCIKFLKLRLTTSRFVRNITKCYRHHVRAERARGHIMKEG